MREVLQQRGSIQPGYFAVKFGVDVLARLTTPAVGRDGYLADTATASHSREMASRVIRCCNGSFARARVEYGRRRHSAPAAAVPSESRADGGHVHGDGASDTSARDRRAERVCEPGAAARGWGFTQLKR
jgi:hypothetical protein